MMHRCAWMDFAFSLGGNSRLSFISMAEPVFDRCGLCDKWIPRELALCARDSSSFDEFRLRKMAAGFDQFRTDELDDWFAERKATPAQLRAMKKISESKHIVPPAMAWPSKIDDYGRIHDLEASASFYTVQNWLSKNIDGGRETPDETDQLSNMMI